MNLKSIDLTLSPQERAAFILVTEKLTSLIKEASPDSKEINYMLYSNALVETNDTIRSIINGNLQSHILEADKYI
jgi:hypothetical protein